MTKFITYFNICPIPEPKDFLGISPDKEEGNIITTLDKNIAIIIKISTQKQIKSWTFLEKLSTKVVFDKNVEKYVGVFAGKTIRCWDENITDINKCKKYKFQKSIADLISTDNETIVLYIDGSCETLQTAIEKRKEVVVSQQLEHTTNLQFSDAAVRTLANSNRIVTYFEYNKSTEERHLVCLSLENMKTNQPARRFKLKRENLDVQVAGFAVIEGVGTPILLTIWSDKRIFLLNLTDDVSSECSPGKFASILPQLKTDSPLSVLGISGHFVAIYGANDGQEGASLLLYNTQYKVLKTKQYFKVYFDFSKLWAINNYIILAMGQNLSAVQYRLLKEILSELVGTQINNNDCFTALEDDPINEEELLEDCLQYTNEHIHSFEKYNISKSLKAITDIVEADGKNVPFVSSDNFNKILNELTHTNLHVEVIKASSGESIDETGITLMNNYHDYGFITPEIETIAMHLEKIGASEQEITEKLLKVLIKADLMDDIEVCLKRYTNISERMLSKTLQYILKRFTNEQLKNNEKSNDNMNVNINVNGNINPVHHNAAINDSTKTEMEVDEDNNLENNQMDHSAVINDSMNTEIEMEVEDNINLDNNVNQTRNVDKLVETSHSKILSNSNTQRILNTILSCSIDPSTIAGYIKLDIEYSEVIIMLQHLYDMLTDLEITNFEERPTPGHPNNDLSVHFEMQLFRWFGILLDGHFPKLVLSTDINLIDLLFKWHELFLKYREEMDELESTAALLYNIVEHKNTLNYDYNSKWYSIEEVELF